MIKRSLWLIISFTMFIMLIKIMKEYHRTIDKLRVAQEKFKKSNDVLYQASITDDLTGLYNRGRIIELNKADIALYQAKSSGRNLIKACC